MHVFASPPKKTLAHLTGATHARETYAGKEDGCDHREQQGLFKILIVFTTAAWVELTEKWYKMPPTSGTHFACVSNLSPLDYRLFGEIVWEEVKESTQPLYAHCCAQCGRLLHSRTAASHLPSDVGRPGMACQLRGRVAAWTAMPIFLLLWSKKRLGHLLRSVCAYDAEAGKLILKGPWSTAPWLHLAPGTTKPRAEEQKPWWCCIDCHDYFAPTLAGERGQRVPKTQVRVPMRNRQESSVHSMAPRRGVLPPPPQTPTALPAISVSLS